MLQPKDTGLLNGYKNKIHIYAVYKRPTSDLGTRASSGNRRTEQRGGKQIGEHEACSPGRETFKNQGLGKKKSIMPNEIQLPFCNFFA